jgi:hypothetical protein
MAPRPSLTLAGLVSTLGVEALRIFKEARRDSSEDESADVRHISYSPWPEQGVLAGRLLRKELGVACTEHSSIIRQAHILTSLFPKLPRCLACILPNFQCIRRRVRQHKVAG